MPIMPWDKSLDIGVEAMNDEHQGLLDLMNGLYDAQDQGAPADRKLRLLNALETATRTHFASEEAYFDAIGFPDARRHKLIHQQLLERLEAGAAKIRSEGGAIDPSFFEFLKYWLTAHIKGIDRKYAEFDREQVRARAS